MPKVLLLTEEQKHDSESFLKNVGPGFEYAESIDQCDLMVVVGASTAEMYSQQILLASKMEKQVLFASDMEQAANQVRYCNDMPGNRNMEFSHSIGYER